MYDEEYNYRVNIAGFIYGMNPLTDFLIKRNYTKCNYRCVFFVNTPAEPEILVIHCFVSKSDGTVNRAMGFRLQGRQR